MVRSSPKRDTTILSRNANVYFTWTVSGWKDSIVWLLRCALCACVLVNCSHAIVQHLPTADDVDENWCRCIHSCIQKARAHTSLCVDGIVHVWMIFDLLLFFVGFVFMHTTAALLVSVLWLYAYVFLISFAHIELVEIRNWSSEDVACAIRTKIVFNLSLSSLYVVVQTASGNWIHFELINRGNNRVRCPIGDTEVKLY